MSANSLLSGLNAVKTLMKEFESIDAYLRATREIMEDGHMPDIAGLDDRVARLCSVVEEVHPEIQERCITKLDDLLQKLNDCEDQMAEFHNKKLQSAQK